MSGSSAKSSLGVGGLVGIDASHTNIVRTTSTAIAIGQSVVANAAVLGGRVRYLGTRWNQVERGGTRWNCAIKCDQDIQADSFKKAKPYQTMPLFVCLFAF